MINLKDGLVKKERKNKASALNATYLIEKERKNSQGLIYILT